MAHCIISGANGFIGSALHQALLKRGDTVTPITREYLYNPEILWNFVHKENPDYIFHIAAYGNNHTQKEDQLIFDANVLTTWNLLFASKDIEYQKFVYISTSSVSLPIQTVYSATKAAAEKLCTAFDKPIIVVRPYSVTGVGEQENHLIPTLIDGAYTGKTVPFVPHPVHDFIDIFDVVQGIIAITEDSSTTDGTICLGSGRAYSNQDVLSTVEFVTGKKVNIYEVNSLRSYDTNEWISPQDWATKTLKQSIEEMVNAYQKR